MVRFFDLLLSLNETFVVLTLSLLSGTCLIWTSISSLDGILVDLALSLLNMTCLIFCQCDVHLTLLSLVLSTLLEWNGVSLDLWTLLYTSTPSFRQNMMNLVSQDLVVFYFILWHTSKSLVLKGTACHNLMWVVNLSLALRLVRDSPSFLGPNAMGLVFQDLSYFAWWLASYSTSLDL